MAGSARDDRGEARHAPLRRAAALSFFVLVALHVATSCAEAGTDDGTVVDAGSSSGAIAPATCPVVAPPAGGECLVPEGTTCAFGPCDTRFARCTGGAWRYSDNDPGQPICPSQPPAAGESCPPCFPTATSCLYGSADCNAADASTNRVVAACVSGLWTLGLEPCRDGGGPDVQGDGGPDAD